MTLYPVILCGGAGTRLWPASRPSRPKQFMPLAGNRSLFQDTAARVAPLCEAGELIVVAGVSHRAAILEQLSALELTAQLILEPEGRDSAPAMAAAAAWTARRSPDGVNVFVASDHHVPDHTAFVEAARRGAEAARDGRIVTLGVRPTTPSSAYGYIAPSGPELSDVAAFVEKPDRAAAERYLAQGYLWNSGNFIASAATLLDELAVFAPAVLESATAAIVEEDAASSILTLGPSFVAAPKISIDYAVMEKTERASVLAVDFDWSDLGAWDAVADSGAGGTGAALLEDSERCLVRAADGVMVAAIGVRDLAIIVEPDAVLVCDLAQSQNVKAIVERLREASPQHLDFAAAESETLEDGAARFSDWLRLRALPVWSSIGQNPYGAFAELLSLDVRTPEAQRRARVQARQIHVMAEAGRKGWTGNWRTAVEHALTFLDARFLRPDDRMRTLLSPDGASLDDTAMLYDQAFLLLARASAHGVGIGADHTTRAAELRDRLLADGPPTGGLVEAGAHPFQSNAHMHLLEACLAWEADGDAGWGQFADRIVAVARQHFIDPDQGCLREFFSADWSPAPGDDGRRIEPGHQFEWAWLMARYGRSRQDDGALADAHRLYAFGLRGIDPLRQVAIDAVAEDGSIVDTRARLWPQTEWMKAALILAETAEGAERQALLDAAAAAQRAIWKYLTDDGVWRDKLLEDGSFIDEPAPASSLYHLFGAWAQLADTARRLDLPFADRVTLA